jgi:serine/threonine protein kinase
MGTTSRDGGSTGDAAPRVGPYRLGPIVRRRGRLVTYRARDDGLGREVLLTAIGPSDRGDHDPDAELRRVAELLARLGGGACPQLFELREEPRGLVLVCEAIRGSSFAELLASGRLEHVPWEARVGLLVGACRALDALHAEGLAHLELCPDQFVVDASGEVRLASIGLGVRASLGASVPEIAGPSAHADYRAPEEILDEEAGLAADVFALGVVAALVIAGHHPFEGPEPGSESIARRVRRGVAARLALPGAPRALERAISAAIEPSQALRLPNARAFEHALLDALGHDRDARADALTVLDALGLGRRPDRPPPPRPVAWSRILTRVVVGLFAAALGLWIALALRATSPGPAPVASTSRATGGLRVLVRPWADVWVDGRLVDTTPIGAPIPLAPGPHEVVLKHPAAAEERRRVEVRAGDVTALDVELRVVRPRPASSDESP